MKLRSLLLLTKLLVADNEKIQCYNCRHEMYDGVPVGDEDCEVLTGYEAFLFKQIVIFWPLICQKTVSEIN